MPDRKTEKKFWADAGLAPEFSTGRCERGRGDGEVDEPHDDRRHDEQSKLTNWNLSKSATNRPVLALPYYVAAVRAVLHKPLQFATENLGKSWRIAAVGFATAREYV